MNARFKDRKDAGRILADKLSKYTNHPNAVVLALPRGGVPVAYEVAQELGLPLDVLIVRKLGVPNHEELAMGAIASGGIRFLNRSVIESLRILPETLEAVERREALELMRREAIYRGNRSPIQVEGRIVILIDDGIATGSTMRVAIQLLRAQHVQKIIVATPAAPPSAKWEIEPLVDEFIAVVLPPDFYGVGQFYEDFAQMDDDTIYELVQMGAKIEPVGAL
ncbi:MAG: phosphoribosyltransferase [Verrucomicrobia bacterium]|jgi:putative phosphoribosyl transferase|nr:phosphoribosyltransferase [Verrucomicrobiota bacterium]